MFINTVPVRIRIEPALEFVALARKIQREWLRSEPHHHLSLADVQSATGLGSELLDHALVIENYPLSEGLEHIQQELQGLFTITDVDPVDQANYPLMLEVHPGDQLQVLLSYDRAVHDDRMMGEVKAQLLQILTIVLASPEASVERINEQLMSDAEKAERAAFTQSLDTVSEEF